MVKGNKRLALRISDELDRQIEKKRGVKNRSVYIRGVLEDCLSDEQPEDKQTQKLLIQTLISERDFLREQLRNEQRLRLDIKATTTNFIKRFKFW